MSHKHKWQFEGWARVPDPDYMLKDALRFVCECGRIKQVEPIY